MATFGRKTARSYLGGAIRGTPTWLTSIMLITLSTPHNSLDNTRIMQCIMHTVTSLWHLLLSPYDWHPTPRTRRVLPIFIPRCILVYWNLMSSFKFLDLVPQSNTRHLTYTHSYIVYIHSTSTHFQLPIIVPSPRQNVSFPRIWQLAYICCYAMFFFFTFLHLRSSYAVSISKRSCWVVMMVLVLGCNRWPSLWTC